MKKVVMLNDLEASDITYSYLYEEYLRLLEKDIILFFEPSSLVHVACPGCGKAHNKNIYNILKMNFKLCSDCGTHYVSPRPDQKTLDKFNRFSKACIYWRKVSLNLPKSKLGNLHYPRINWILELTDEFLDETLVFMDFKAKYPFVISELYNHNIFETLVIFDSKVYEQSNLLPNNVIRINTEDNYSGKVNMIIAFETLERMFDPGKLFSSANKYCAQGGMLLITTASCSGFEYQVLGEYAPNINPINRMNLLSLEALKNRVEEIGFEIVELSTPGRLDTKIVQQVINDSDEIKIDPFWKYIFKYRNENTWKSLQDFLQLNLLSSHVRIAARKISD